METVIRFQFTETRKMTALIDVIDRTNEYTNPENNADFINGKETRQNVVKLFAPKLVEASSIEGSTCLKLFAPASIPTVIFLNVNAIIKIAAVPVSSKGLSLKARTYPIPTTVPGTANVRIVENSISFFPTKFLRIIKKAISIPSNAVMGVEAVAIISEFFTESKPRVKMYLK